MQLIFPWKQGQVDVIVPTGQAGKPSCWTCHHSVQRQREARVFFITGRRSINTNPQWCQPRKQDTGGCCTDRRHARRAHPPPLGCTHLPGAWGPPPQIPGAARPCFISLAAPGHPHTCPCRKHGHHALLSGGTGGFSRPAALQGCKGWGRGLGPPPRAEVSPLDAPGGGCSPSPSV